MDVGYSVIVPAYNESDYLVPTLEALHEAMASISLHGELIVCDNNSTDDTAELARRADARVVFEAVNQISRARNAGAREARGRYLLFVDADTHISPRLLRTALEQLESGRCIGGGTHVQLAPPLSVGVRFIVGLWNRISSTFRLAAGCFFWCVREDFEAVGGFSETVYASEEIWLSRLLRRRGRKTGRRFCILRDYPAISSGRKQHWFSMGRQLGLLAMVVFFPFFVRYKRLCSYWYERPER
ncbi:MAG: glycosyltransferase [Acidiferrobacteraceae bacterium]|jgi:glycosyltransferase involved in cell wall biosynthesis